MEVRAVPCKNSATEPTRVLSSCCYEVGTRFYVERARMSQTTDAAKKPNKWAILFTVLIMTFMATLDSSIVNVALPVMQKALEAGLGQIQWVSSVYLLTMCAFLLVFGRLGDLHGKVRFFEFGVVIFTIGSLMCGLSTTLPALVVSRAVQGIGGASAMANNMGIITEAFPARERGRALGLLASFVALGMMCGPVLGGFIVAVMPWEYIFLINVPVGVLSLVLGRFTLPRTGSTVEGGTMDVFGAVLLVPGMLLTFLSVTMLQSNPGLLVAGSFAVGVILLVLFVRHERAVEQPLVAFGIFCDRHFVVNLICLFISFVAIGVYELMTPFYLQDARGFDPGLSGLIFCVIPWPTHLSVLFPVRCPIALAARCPRAWGWRRSASACISLGRWGWTPLFPGSCSAWALRHAVRRFSSRPTIRSSWGRCPLRCSASPVAPARSLGTWAWRSASPVPPPSSTGRWARPRGTRSRRSLKAGPTSSSPAIAWCT